MQLRQNGDLARPYMGGGVPYNFGQYDRDFFELPARNNRRVSLAGHMTSPVALQITVSQLSFAGDYLTPTPPPMPSGNTGVQYTKVPVSCTAPSFTVTLHYRPELTTA